MPTCILRVTEPSYNLARDGDDIDLDPQYMETSCIFGHFYGKESTAHRPHPALASLLTFCLMKKTIVGITYASNNSPSESIIVLHLIAVTAYLFCARSQHGPTAMHTARYTHSTC